MFCLWLICDKSDLYVWRWWTCSQILCWWFTCFFSLSIISGLKVSVFQGFFPLHMYSPLQDLSDLTFCSIDFHKNTSTFLVCWISLVIYVLWCCTCPNSIILTVCNAFVCFIKFSSYSLHPLVVDRYNFPDSPQNLRLENYFYPKM